MALAGAATLACLAVFASRVAWYDLRIVLPSLQLAMRPLFAVYACCLLPFIVYAYHKRGTWTGGGSLVWAFHAMLAYGWIVCLVGGEGQLNYALQDTLKLLFVPAVFFLFAAAPPRCVETLLNRLAWVIVGYQVIRLGLFVVLRPGFFYFGGVTDAFPVCYFLARLIYGRDRRVVGDVACLLLSLGLVGIGQKRTLLAALAAVFLAASIRGLRKMVARPALQAAALAVAAVLALAVARVSSMEDSQLFDRVRSTDLSVLFTEETSRQMEVRDVYDHLRGFGRQALVFGLGHGATFERYEADHSTGEVIVHSVHFTPAAMQLRYGLPGLALYAAIVFGVVFAKPPRPTEFCDATAILTLRNYGVAATVCSIGMFGLVDDMLVGLTIATFYYARRVRPEAATSSHPAETDLRARR